MNDIQQLIDRYLAEGLSSDELARLSRAVHRTDAPEEWLVIREMIDTLSEGEDDYDLMMALKSADAERSEAPQTGSVPATMGEQRTLAQTTAAPASRTLSLWKGWRIAASVCLVAAIGATVFFTRHHEPELANAKKDSVTAPVQSVKTVEAPPVAEAPNSLTMPGPSPKSTKKGLAAVTRPTSRRSRVSAPATATSNIAETNEVPAMTYDVPERRIYSCNLLDQVSDYDDAPTPATDGY